MRWLADECVDAALVSRLRGAGHDVSYTAEIASGSTDTEVLRRAHDDGRLLLTEDKDFGELVFRSKRAVPGLGALTHNPLARQRPATLADLPRSVLSVPKIRQGCYRETTES